MYQVKDNEIVIAENAVGRGKVKGLKILKMFLPKLVKLGNREVIISLLACVIEAVAGDNVETFIIDLGEALKQQP